MMVMMMMDRQSEPIHYFDFISYQNTLANTVLTLFLKPNLYWNQISHFQFDHLN